MKHSANITLRQLEIFVAVVETRQVTKASEKLHLTQSAVSMALNELQQQLGGPIFDRQGRNLRINDRGRYLLPLAKDILDRVNNIEALMNEESHMLAGSLEIVASSTIGNYVMPYLIAAFKKMHENISINMQVYNTKHAETLIVDGKADLGFVEGEVRGDEISAIPWFQDELVVITSPDNKLARRKLFRMPEDLPTCRWVMREKGSGTAHIFKKKLGSYVQELETVTEFGDTEAIKKAVEAGVGVACLSSLTVCREVEHGWLNSLSVKGLDMHRQLHIIHYKNKALTNVMKEFVNFCTVMAECSLGAVCLASPGKLNDLLKKR